MPTKGQITGMRGVFLVAAELTACGLIVSTTSRNAFGADLLVTDQHCKNAWSVQVKTNGKRAGSWLLSAKSKDITSKSHIYVLVNILKDPNKPEFYVVPSKTISTRMTSTVRTTGSEWFAIRRDKAIEFKDRWTVFEGIPQPA
jgi:hypothetical protein